VPPFIVAQVVGGGLAMAAIRFLYPDIAAADASTVVVPRAPDETIAGDERLASGPRR
jgi:hypothetical protein